MALPCACCTVRWTVRWTDGGRRQVLLSSVLVPSTHGLIVVSSQPSPLCKFTVWAEHSGHGMFEPCASAGTRAQAQIWRRIAPGPAWGAQPAWWVQSEGRMAVDLGSGFLACLQALSMPCISISACLDWGLVLVDAVPCNLAPLQAFKHTTTWRRHTPEPQQLAPAERRGTGQPGQPPRLLWSRPRPPAHAWNATSACYGKHGM